MNIWILQFCKYYLQTLPSGWLIDVDDGHSTLHVEENRSTWSHQFPTPLSLTVKIKWKILYSIECKLISLGQVITVFYETVTEKKISLVQPGIKVTVQEFWDKPFTMISWVPYISVTLDH